MMRDLKTEGVPSLERAFAALETLAQSRRGQSLADLARRISMPKSSLHCVLLTLERKGYVERDRNTYRYVIGPRLFSLAHLGINQSSVKEAALPVLHSVMQETKLTVHMAIQDGAEAVLIEKIEPPGLLRLATWVGKRMEIHCTGVGKAILAHLPEDQVDEILASRTFPRHNENTIVGSRKLREHLKVIRKLGYAFDDEEDEIGLRCIGAPVFSDDGRVLAAISVAGTTVQIAESNYATVVQIVKSAGIAISRCLGFHPADASRTAVKIGRRNVGTK